MQEKRPRELEGLLLGVFGVAKLNPSDVGLTLLGLFS
jgi:hypothetical protein